MTRTERKAGETDVLRSLGAPGKSIRSCRARGTWTHRRSRVWSISSMQRSRYWWTTPLRRVQLVWPWCSQSRSWLRTHRSRRCDVACRRSASSGRWRFGAPWFLGAMGYPRPRCPGPSNAFQEHARPRQARRSDRHGTLGRGCGLVRLVQLVHLMSRIPVRPKRFGKRCYGWWRERLNLRQ